MDNNTILRIKVPAHLYESVKEQLTLTEADKAKKQFGAEFSVVKEKKAPKDGMKKVEEAPKEEAKMEEAVDPNLIAGIIGVLMGGGPIVASILRDYKNAKTPEEKKEVLKKASQAIGSKMGGSMEEKKEMEAEVKDKVEEAKDKVKEKKEEE